MKNALTPLFFWMCCASASLFAQITTTPANPWVFLADQTARAELRSDKATLPERYALARLNVDEMKNMLVKAPMQFSPEAESNPLVLMLPMPDRTFERFSVVNSPMMEPEEAEKNPTILSYAGYGIDDPTAYMRFVLTPLGFSSMVLSDRSGTLLIDQAYPGNVEQYIIYNKNDYQIPFEFECLTETLPPQMPGTEKAAAAKTLKNCTFRTYRLALACTGEFSKSYIKNSKMVSGFPLSRNDSLLTVSSYFSMLLSRINTIFNKELYINLLSADPTFEKFIFLDPTTDPYVDWPLENLTQEQFDQYFLEVNQKVCDSISKKEKINYDIGHLFLVNPNTPDPGSIGGGISNQPSICNNKLKARGASFAFETTINNAFFYLVVAHEIAHQFGASHTFNDYYNDQINRSKSVEPGSGSTIMSYATVASDGNGFPSANKRIQSLPDPYFHGISLEEIFTTISNSSCGIESTIYQSLPSVSVKNGLIIPKSTPFFLAPDKFFPSGVTYCWEQMDNGDAVAPPECKEDDGPLFRSRPPSNSPTRYFPELGATLNNFKPIWEVLPCSGRTLNFRLTVRGGDAGYCTEMYDISLKVAGNAGPFKITSPMEGERWTVCKQQVVKWDPAGTQLSPVNCKKVKIWLSDDGGKTFAYLLDEDADNDGLAVVSIPETVETAQARIKVEAIGNIFFAISPGNFVISRTSATEDYAALSALYNATNGPNWKNKQKVWLKNCDPCTWYGVQCKDGKVVGLNLFNNGLSGTLPPEIGKLINLDSLNLGSNQLKGSIPAKIGNLANLRYLNLGANQLTGAIPAEIGKLGAINTLNLQNNKLSGCLPGTLSALCGKTVNLSGNPQLPGAGSAAAWSAFCNSGGIVGADINGDGICETTSNCNHPDYSVLAALYNATNGPKWSNNTNWLKNCDPCTWYGVICANSRVVGLNLGNNNLAGAIPAEIGNLERLASLDLADNQLHGNLPASIGKLKALQTLWLGRNQLTGSIPGEIGSLKALTELSLEENRLTGPIPNAIGGLSNLKQLFLHGNQLSGEIPEELSNLFRLTGLELSNNRLSGTLPSSLGSLSSLRYLFLSGNQLSGSIPAAIGNLSNLQNLDLEQNMLTGPIPEALSKLGNLTNLNLGSNQLSGPIPRNIWSLINLSKLTLSHNALSGPIPFELGAMRNLQELLLNNNQLSGCIPVSFTSLCGKKLDLSNNPNLPSGGSAAAWNAFCSSGGTIGADTNGDGICETGVVTEHPDFAALKALYIATNGDNWTNNTGWLKNGDPCSGWFGVTCSEGRVVRLNLSENGLNGIIPAEVGKLANLQELILAANQLSGSIPIEITNLSKLHDLRLSANQLSGTIPTQIGNLTNLKYLWLSANQLGGTIPTQIGNLEYLNDLFLSDNQLVGHIPPQIGNLKYLKNLWLSYNQLSGSIPTQIENLINLNWFALNNNQLSGSIPSLIGNLTNLKDLRLFNNQFSGCIPTNFINLCGKNVALFNNPGLPGGGSAEAWQAFCSSGGIIGADTNGDGICETSAEHPDYAALKALYMATNGDNWTNNTGWLKNGDPCSGWYGVTCSEGRVVSLNLSKNSLNGAIPAEVGNLAKLHELNLNYNQLSSSIPNAIGNLSNLTVLELSSNQLIGSIPNTMGNLSSLSWLSLVDNQLSSSIPSTIGNLLNLQVLFLFNNQFSGPIPSEIGNLLNLESLDLHNNQLSSSIPNSIGNLTNLEFLNLGTNQLSGSIPSEIGNLLNLQWLYLNNNQLSGSIPSEIGNLSNLRVLWLDGNQLSGLIPSSIGNLSKLQWVYANGNQLSGSIPSSIGNLSNLEVLGFTHNQLSGSIPSTIGNLSNLQYLYLHNNQLSGSIPSEIGNLVNLEELNLQTNQLSGSIPTQIGNLPNLKILLLGENQLSGSIPTQIMKLSTLESLHLGGNQLTGSIPIEIGDLLNLQSLGLYNNRLTGSIPNQIGDLTNLRTIYLFGNQLSGSIPSQIGNLPYLLGLDLNNNNLSGCIPLTFINLCGKSVSLFNNPGLPGGGFLWNTFCSSGGIIGADTNGDGICETTVPGSFSGSDASAGIPSQEAGVRHSSGQFELNQNIPNPFQSETRISFTLPEAGEAVLTVQDITGRLVYSIQGQYAEGYNEIVLQNSALKSSGVLYYTLRAGKHTATRKMVMLE